MSNSVHPLHMASVNLAGKFNTPGYLDVRIQVYAYLVITGSDVILVDSGVGYGNSYIDKQFKPSRNDIADELASVGVNLVDVNIIINSHLHFDHCGSNCLFPQAQIYVQAKELEVAQTDHYTVREWFSYPAAKVNVIEGDEEICAGVKVLSTPGHTPGHQSVLVETSGGKVLVAAQAAFCAEEYVRGGDPAEQAYEGLAGQYVQSITKLKSLRTKEIYFSHDDEGV